MSLELIISVVSAITSIIFGGIAVLQARRARRFQEKLSHVQGAFSSATIDIAVFGRKNITKLVITAPFEPKSTLEVPLRFSIDNTSAKTAKDVEIIVSVPRELSYGGVSAEVRFTSASPKIVGQSYGADDWRKKLLIRSESLHPQQGLQLMLPVSLSGETDFKSSAPVTTSDGVALSLTYTALYSYRLDILVLQADQPPKSWSCKVEVLNTSSLSPRLALARHYRLIETAEKSHPIKKTIEHCLILDMPSSNLRRDAMMPISRPIEPDKLVIYPGLVIDDKNIYVPSLKDDSSQCPTA
jgi:hypothetical protein